MVADGKELIRDATWELRPPGTVILETTVDKTPKKVEWDETSVQERYDGKLVTTVHKSVERFHLSARCVVKVPPDAESTDLTIHLVFPALKKAQRDAVHVKPIYHQDYDTTIVGDTLAFKSRKIVK